MIYIRINNKVMAVLIKSDEPSKSEGSVKKSDEMSTEALQTMLNDKFIFFLKWISYALFSVFGSKVDWQRL